MTDPATFCSRIYLEHGYSNFMAQEKYYAFAQLRSFTENFELENFKALQSGSGRSAFQDLVSDYTGLDIYQSVANRYHKLFMEGSGSDHAVIGSFRLNHR